jgi:hypothetical protein
MHGATIKVKTMNVCYMKVLKLFSSMWGVKGNLFELTKPRGVQFCVNFLF